MLKRYVSAAGLLQVRTLKQQGNALADQASNAKFKLVDAQQEQLKLKGQIVEVTGAQEPFFLQFVSCYLHLNPVSRVVQLHLLW